jgi:P-type Cu+ transporter
MGVAGSDVAVEAAHIALLPDDWTLIRGAIAIARRTMRVVNGNLIFTAAYRQVDGPHRQILEAR